MKIIIQLISIISVPFLVGIFMPEADSAPKKYAFDLNPDPIQGPFTGGFGEETCRSCHFDYDLNMEGGSLEIRGLSDTYKPDNDYEITVKVESEQLEVGGFQITSRFEDGTQAGSFDWDGDHLMYTPNIEGEVKYLQHSLESTEPTKERSVEWTFTWKAPDSNSSPVIINIASNAGNDDDSSFGDWIYAKEIIIKPED